MKFNIDNYNGKYAMHCKTPEEAREFCNYMHSLGRRWLNGKSYYNYTFFDYHGPCTVYHFNNDSFGHIFHAKNAGFKVLEWSDFTKKEFDKSHLQNGDVIMFRNGQTAIFIKDIDAFVSEGDFIHPNDIKADLTHCANPQYDIIAVRRPKFGAQCRLIAFKCGYGNLVYERKNVVKMTLEEVCKALGKEIEIVETH